MITRDSCINSYFPPKMRCLLQSVQGTVQYTVYIGLGQFLLSIELCMNIIIRDPGSSWSGGVKGSKENIYILRTPCPQKQIKKECCCFFKPSLPTPPLPSKDVA